MIHKKALSSTLKKTDMRVLSEIIWDADVKRLDLEKDKRSIIERALMYGREEHIKWVRMRFTLEDIAETVKSSSNLDERTANYWSIKLHISRAEIKCFFKPSALI